MSDRVHRRRGEELVPHPASSSTVSAAAAASTTRYVEMCAINREPRKEKFGPPLM